MYMAPFTVKTLLHGNDNIESEENKIFINWNTKIY